MDQKLDKQRTQEFARKLFGFYTSGVLTLMVDIGHRTGLFEAVAKGPGGSQEIAARARLSERYVREWLCALATGGVLEYDAASRTFSLPPEHAVCLTGTSSRNLAAASQGLPMLAARLARVVECFRNGGGVPYSEYRPDFTEFMDASWRLLYDGLLVKGFLPAAKGLPERLEKGIRVPDLGCGTGHAINLMARHYPNSTFVGYDLGDDAIVRPRAACAARQASRGSRPTKRRGARTASTSAGSGRGRAPRAGRRIGARRRWGARRRRAWGVARRPRGERCPACGPGARVRVERRRAAGPRAAARGPTHDGRARRPRLQRCGRPDGAPRGGARTRGRRPRGEGRAARGDAVSARGAGARDRRRGGAADRANGRRGRMSARPSRRARAPPSGAPRRTPRGARLRPRRRRRRGG